MGQIAPEPVKSLIVKLPAKKTIKPESPNLGRNDLDHLATVASGLPAYTSTSAIDNYPSSRQYHDHPLVCGGGSSLQKKNCLGTEAAGNIAMANCHGSRSCNLRGGDYAAHHWCNERVHSEVYSPPSPPGRHDVCWKT